jgi:hypothetical protein
MTENESEKQDFRLELAQQVLVGESMQAGTADGFNCTTCAALITACTAAGLFV